MNPNLYALQDGRILDISNARIISHSGTSQFVVTATDGTTATYNDAGLTVFNKILANSN